MEFLSDYGLFLAKSVTIVFAIIAVVGGIAVVAGRDKKAGNKGAVEVTHLNEELEEMKLALEEAVLDKDELKALIKEEKKRDKAERKERKKNKQAPPAERRKRIYVLDFDGDIKASDVEPMREEISAVLTMAEPKASRGIPSQRRSRLRE